MAHAALYVVAGALALDATVLRSTFRPTRAIQISCFQRWAPEPREITAIGFEPAFDGERTVSPRHARFGGSSFCRSRRAPNLWRPVTNVGQPLVPGASDGSSRIFAAALWCNRAASRFRRAFHPCSSRRRPRQSFRSTRPTHQTNGFCNAHDPRTRSTLFAPPDSVTFRPASRPVRVRDDNSRCRRQIG